MTKTVHNFMSPKPLKTYPAAMEYGIRNEQDAKDAYMKIMKKKHANLTIEEPGLMLGCESRRYQKVCLLSQCFVGN